MVRQVDITRLYAATRTEGYVDQIRPLAEDSCVIASPQLRERGQARRAHPVLEMFVLLQIRRRCRVGIPIREACRPIWWGRDFVNVIPGGCSILSRFARPSDTVL